jgi:non-specific serine/threonine protein kinase
MTSAAAFGQALREYRYARRLTQAELAERAGLSERAVSDLERGLKTPQRTTVRLLSGALGLSPDLAESFELAARSPVARSDKPASSQITYALTARTLTTERRSNLPVRRLPLVGREHDLQVLRPLVLGSDGHLLTLTGTGGCGKTSLALELAHGQLDAFPAGVWFVDLAPLREPLLVPEAVAAALEIHDVGERSLVDTLVAVVAEQTALVLLDNCEHLIDASASLVFALLQACPNLRILATSREPLRVAGEVVWRVAPLKVPDIKHQPQLSDVSRSPSVQLFVACARANRPEFALAESNAGTVARICARVDGLPLALELAAARTRTLAVAQVLTRLDESFRLLVGGSRSAPSRQQTLQAALDWSYDLLTEPEQILFRRLAVFAGGFGLSAAEMVCAGGDLEEFDVLDYLTQLVDKSLIVVEERSGEAWYRLLEPVRQYALDRLTASRESEALFERHAETYLGLAEEAKPHLFRGDQDIWFDRLESHLDNVRAALNWAARTQDGLELGLRMAGVLWRFWDGRCHISEGRQWLDELLARDSQAETSPGRAHALFAAGWLAAIQESAPAAMALSAMSVKLWRQLGDSHGLMWGLWLEGLALQSRDPGTAVQCAEEALAIARSIGDEIVVPWLLFVIGQARRFQGDTETAVRVLEEALLLEKELGDLGAAGFILRALAELWMGQGNYFRATELLRERLALSRTLNNRWNIADTVEGLAWLAREQGSPDRATRLFGAAHAMREATGATLLGERLSLRDHRLDLLRAELGDTGANTAWREGYSLTFDQLVDYALAANPTPTQQPS